MECKHAFRYRGDAVISVVGRGEEVRETSYYPSAHVWPSCYAGDATKENQSPRMPKSLGHVEVEGLDLGKDFKLYPGGGREWD